MTKNNLKTKAYIFITLISMISTSAQAAGGGGMFVEPALTFENGSTEGNFPSPLRNSEGDISGLGFGLRGGAHLGDIVFLGLDLRYSMLSFKDSTINYDADATAFNWGPVVGVKLPIVGLRAWGSLILGGNLDPDASRNFNVKFSDASGFRLGAGFQLLLVSLNLEYQSIKYDHTELEQVGPFSSNSALNNVSLEQSSWVASVSFPLSL